MKKPSVLATAIVLSASSLVIPTVSAGEAEIQEVMVSASLVPIAANKSANAITVIDSEQLRNRAALSVSDLLRDVPGLAVSRSGVQGSQTQIRARGAEANHLLVLIDGVEANDPSQSDELNWGVLAADDIERIEVIRGPQSSMRGSDAMAGVVNIITRSASAPFSAAAFTEVGSFSTKRSGFNLGAKNLQKRGPKNGPEKVTKNDDGTKKGPKMGPKSRPETELKIDPNMISLRIGPLRLSRAEGWPCRRKREGNRKGKGALKYVQKRKGGVVRLFQYV